VQKGKIRSLPLNKISITKTIASPTKKKKKKKTKTTTKKKKKKFCDGAGNNGSASGPTPNFVKRKG